MNVSWHGLATHGHSVPTRYPGITAVAVLLACKVMRWTVWTSMMLNETRKDVEMSMSACETTEVAYRTLNVSTVRYCIKFCWQVGRTALVGCVMVLFDSGFLHMRSVLTWLHWWSIQRLSQAGWTLSRWRNGLRQERHLYSTKRDSWLHFSGTGTNCLNQSS